MITVNHDPDRRKVLLIGGGLVLSAAFMQRVQAADTIEISMSGTTSGSHVWFRPLGLLIQPGQAVKWTNDDTGNVHTVTAYHPDNGKPLRIPNEADSWNSDYLMPGESFTVTFTHPGVYDYFCIPHEQAGMVGRIVVGRLNMSDAPYPASDQNLPPLALARLPDVSAIIKLTIVE